MRCFHLLGCGHVATIGKQTAAFQKQVNVSVAAMHQGHSKVNLHAFGSNMMDQQFQTAGVVVLGRLPQRGPHHKTALRFSTAFYGLSTAFLRPAAALFCVFCDFCVIFVALYSFYHVYRDLWCLHCVFMPLCLFGRANRNKVTVRV